MSRQESRLKYHLESSERSRAEALLVPLSEPNGRSGIGLYELGIACATMVGCAIMALAAIGIVSLIALSRAGV